MAEILGRLEKKMNPRVIKTNVSLHVRKDDAWSGTQGKRDVRPIKTSVK